MTLSLSFLAAAGILLQPLPSPSHAFAVLLKFNNQFPTPYLTLPHSIQPLVHVPKPLLHINDLRRGNQPLFQQPLQPLHQRTANSRHLVKQLDWHRVKQGTLGRALLGQSCQPNQVCRELRGAVWRGGRGGRKRASAVCRRGSEIAGGQGLEKAGGRVSPSRVNAKAQLAVDISADDVDGPLGVVAVYQEVGADVFVVGEAQAVPGFVDYGDGFETGQLGQLDGKVC